MTGEDLCDELYDLLAIAEPVPLGGHDVYADRDAYLAIVARLRAAVAPVIAFEHARGETVFGDLLDGLEHLGAPQPTGLSRRHRVDRSKAMALLRQVHHLLAAAEQRVEDERNAPRTRHVDLGDPDAPTLEALVERVERANERFLLTLDGELLADLVPWDYEL